MNIPFNHALSVIRVYVKAATPTDASLIKVKSIKVKNIKNKGDFASAAWTPKGAAVDVVLGEATTATASTPITTAEAQYGNNRIVLPQDFYGSTAEIEIKYYILGQNGEEALEQVAHFALSGQTAVKPGSDPVDSHDHEWKMGKRYNYHITFGLNEIYFAPSITDWVDYDVTVPTID